jgi:hypothetical protein
VLGALYLHYEFPKGAVTLADGSNSVGFGTSWQSADVITGRMIWMVPIHCADCGRPRPSVPPARQISAPPTAVGNETSRVGMAMDAVNATSLIVHPQ